MKQMRVSPRPAAFCLSLVFAAAAVPLAAQDSPAIFTSDLIDRLDYGVYCAEAPVDLQEAPGTVAGVVNVVPELPVLRAETTLVPAQIGIGFGVLVEAADGFVFDGVSITITHPPYPDSGIEVEGWTTSLDDETTGLVGFSFEVESELVTGRWTFEAAHDGDLLFRIDFEVVPAAMLPGVAQGCSGAILS
jgi:hypothetical protein